MKVKDAQFFTVVSSFLNVYLVKNRSCSSNTVKSYEDPRQKFLAQRFLPMVVGRAGNRVFFTPMLYHLSDLRLLEK